VRFFAPLLPDSREGTSWQYILQTLVCYRLIDPGSEWRLHRQWFEQSAMADLLGEDYGLVEKNALYRCLDKLLPHKAALRTNRLSGWRENPRNFRSCGRATALFASFTKLDRWFDGEVYLVADARVDSRSELLDRLRGAGRMVQNEAPDSELILHAYHAWGEACVQRLLGDYSFAVWNARERTLFCVRDHFGVVPFYYATIGEWFVFGNTVEALLAHPGGFPWRAAMGVNGRGHMIAILRQYVLASAYPGLRVRAG
jgi:hypothetical protein